MRLAASFNCEEYRWTKIYNAYVCKSCTIEHARSTCYVPKALATLEC